MRFPPCSTLTIAALFQTDRVELPVRLQAGVNRVLVKVFSRSSNWTFYFHTGAVHPTKAYIKGLEMGREAAGGEDR